MCHICIMRWLYTSYKLYVIGVANVHAWRYCAEVWRYQSAAITERNSFIFIHPRSRVTLAGNKSVSERVCVYTFVLCVICGIYTQKAPPYWTLNNLPYDIKKQLALCFKFMQNTSSAHCGIMYGMSHGLQSKPIDNTYIIRFIHIYTRKGLYILYIFLRMIYSQH